MADKNSRPRCCGKPMAKAGLSWSGRHKVQRYRCSKCGRVTTKTK